MRGRRRGRTKGGMFEGSFRSRRGHSLWWRVWLVIEELSDTPAGCCALQGSVKYQQFVFKVTPFNGISLGSIASVSCGRNKDETVRCEGIEGVRLLCIEIFVLERIGCRW